MKKVFFFFSIKHFLFFLGLIRPFLFLSSMHPGNLLILLFIKKKATRQQIGDILGISLIDMDSYGNSHSESMLLLKKKRKGIQWRTGIIYLKNFLFN